MFPVLPPRLFPPPVLYGDVESQELKEDVAKFRHEWEVSGPMVQGILPLEAVERLRRFKEEMQLRERKVRHNTMNAQSTFRSRLSEKLFVRRSTNSLRPSRVHS